MRQRARARLLPAANSPREQAVVQASGSRRTSGITAHEGGTGPTLIHEGHRLRSPHVADVELANFESGPADEVVHLAVQMASSADPLPTGRQPILPALDAAFRCQSMLDEQQAAARPHDALH